MIDFVIAVDKSKTNAMMSDAICRGEEEKLKSDDNRKKRKTMRLVYKDSKKPPYRFQQLDELLDAIAKSTICYCIGLDEYDGLDEAVKKAMQEKNKKSSKDKTVPMFIRQVCAIICYTLLEYGNFVSIKQKGKHLETNSGVTIQVMTDLFQRCEEYGYPSFSKKNKLFQYDKWSISPIMVS